MPLRVNANNVERLAVCIDEEALDGLVDIERNCSVVQKLCYFLLGFVP